MNATIESAMRTSRSTKPTSANHAQIAAAERTIAGMPDADARELRERIARIPGDGFLRLWDGLQLAEHGQHAEACEQFAAARKLGCNDWRVSWYLAQSARASGNLALVDEACAAVLKANPEFWFARELPKHARGFYGQGEHDRWIEEFFRHQPPRAKVFVEVGAFDGVHYSNVRRLVEKHGWTGLAIEPVEKNFARLSASYAGTPVRCIRAAIAEQEGELDLHVSTYPHLPEWGSDVASLSPGEKQRWEKYRPIWSVEKVPARRLTGLLEEQGVADVDLLSIDAEGHDLDVLRSLDFDRFRPQLIVVEYGQHRESILHHLAGRGYSLVVDNQQDLFMARIQSAASLEPVRNYSGQSGKPPYEEIQRDVEQRLHELIQVPAEELQRIVVVGGYLGYEIDAFLRHYPRTEVHVFEPSRRYFEKLSTRFAGQARVICHNVAVADQAGSATFHEGSLEGVGSLLPLKTKSDANTWLPGNFRPAESYTVPVVTLDGFAPLANRMIDLLWCDVQGAELKVLRGARKTLAHCRALFLEVATFKTTYEGQCRLHELQAELTPHGFHLAGIGLCHSGNGTGNSFWRGRQCRPAAARDEGRPVSRLEVESQINPHLLRLNYLPFDQPVRRVTLDPSELLTSRRFDLAAKLIYARHRQWQVDCGFARELYSEHLRVFTGGRCAEGDGRKNSLEEFQASFDALLDSIGEKGFDAGATLVPVARGNLIIDGAHRVAACLLHNRPVSALLFEREGNEYGASWFQSRGLAAKYTDAMALEYCRVNPQTYIVTLFPSAVGQDDHVRQILAELGAVVYEKSIQLNRHGALALVRQMYAGEPWLGDWSNHFAGARQKMEHCFRGDGPVRVFVFEAPGLERVKQAKERIRALYQISNHSVHINDSHAETLLLARLLLNANSLHFLNFARPQFFNRFERHLGRYRQWLAANGHDPERFCVDGSAVMAAYGIRDAQDLDVLHHSDADFSSVSPEVNSHNRDARHHAFSRDEILFNPELHFYFHGVKFAALDVIRKLKVKRNEGKDQKDVALIDALLSGAGVPEVGTTAPPPKKSGRSPFVIEEFERSPDSAFTFTNDWFATHRPHWERELTAWAEGRGPIQVLEIGSYEGRSACWFLTRLMDDPASHLTCIDAWQQRSGARVYEEDMEGVFARFRANCESTGKASQLTVHRGDTKSVLPGLPGESFDLIYVDGDHSAEGVFADTLEAFRLLRSGGLLLWDDYFWSGSVREGVDKACAQLGIRVSQLGRNASYTKPAKVPSPFVIDFEGAIATTAAVPPPPRRIVGLVPARNEGPRIAFCLRALARYTDAIVYLDDCSDDNTVALVESLAAECRVEKILRKNTWHRDEPGDRNALLEAGRAIGGTHFIVLDADEAFTSNCANGQFLRQLILALQPGDQLAMHWIQLWRGIEAFRFDDSVWTWNRKSIIFCDDGQCSYRSDFIHTSRVPGNLKGRQHALPGYTHGLLHFQFVNWRNLLIKQSWYRCLERLRDPQKPVEAINKRYGPSQDERNLRVRPVPREWLSGYPFFDPAILSAPDEWREKQVLRWFQEFGRDRFAALHIFDVDWGGPRQVQAGPAPAIDSTDFRAEAMKWVQQADQAFQAQDVDTARDRLIRATQFAPDAVDLATALANVHAQLGNWAESRWESRRALALQSDYVPAWVKLAAAAAALGDMAEFERAVEKARNINAQDRDLLHLLASLNFREKRFQEAARGYFEILKLAPDDIDALLALGKCLAELGDRELARETYERVLSLQPGNGIARDNLRALGGAAVTSLPAPPVESESNACSCAPNTESAEPLVTAIVSTYNAESFIRGCLEDLQAQTIASRMEIIVIDSGSPQNERAVVEELQRRHSNIRYVRTEREPLYTAWNRAIKLARGRYITNANTDDRHRPASLERLVQALENNPQAVLAYGDVSFCENVHPDFGYPELRGYYRWPDFDRDLLFANCYIGPQPLWRRDVHQRHGFFDESYKSAGDYEFWLRLAVKETFVHVPEVLGLYWYSEKSVGHDNMDVTRAEADRARATHWRSEWGPLPKHSPSFLKLAKPVSEALGKDPNGQPQRNGNKSPGNVPKTASHSKPKANPIPSPFVLDHTAACLSPTAGAGDKMAAPMGLAHRHLIASFLKPGKRLLAWGGAETVAFLAQSGQGGAGMVWIEHDPARFEQWAPVLRQHQVDCRHRPLSSNDVEARGRSLVEYVTAAGNEGFDVILVDGELRNHCLLRALEQLTPEGVVFLHDAQRPEFDLAKRAAVEFGHMGQCLDAPGAQLWWGGVAHSPLRLKTDPPLNKPVVVNFYTANTGYEEEARRMMASCAARGVECVAEAVPSQGAWEFNCAYKARFILKMWEQLRRPVIWLDADAVLHQRPLLLEGATCDFAIHKVDGWQFASGTLFFNQTPAAELLLRRWVDRCTANPKVWDQVSLDAAWEEVVREQPLHTLWLPDTYTKIFDRVSKFPARDVVVEHFQASRRLKQSDGENPAESRPKYPPDLVAARRASRPLQPALAKSDSEETSPALFGSQIAAGKATGEDVLAHELQAMAQRALDRALPSKACAFLWSAVACAPASVRGWIRLAEVYSHVNDPEAVANIIAQARKAVPHEAPATFQSSLTAVVSPSTVNRPTHMPAQPLRPSGERPAAASNPQCTEDLLATLRGRRVAIVGNGTPTQDLGTQIDAFDVVVRLNNFRIQGFESKVGSKTTYRCTSGWRDIEPRSGHLEFSPFTAQARESANVPAYNERAVRPLLLARTDIHEIDPGLPKPSTGYALVRLCVKVGLEVDLFGFDGFQTPHYWAAAQTVYTTHSGDELERLPRLPGVRLHGGLNSSIHPEPVVAPSETFCLPAGYQSRLTPEYYEDSVSQSKGIVWQPDVYPMVAALARSLGCFHVLDLGCGHGEKLAALHPEFLITGVDYGANLQHCRQAYPFGQWLEANFETHEPLPVPEAVLGRTLVVCSDVIEHLINPTALLRRLKELLERVPALLLSTPERNRARGPGDMGPPKNRAHVREWSLDELESLLRAHGLPVAFIGYTRSNTQSNAFNTQVAIVSRTPLIQSLPAGLRRGDSVGLRDNAIVVLAETAASDSPTPASTSTPAPATEVLAEAEARAREALQLNPNGLEALKLLAAIGVQQARWKETARVCAQVLQQTPGDIETLLILAKCFFKVGDTEMTRLVLERVLTFDPNHALARENLAALGVNPPANAPVEKMVEERSNQLAAHLQAAQAAIEAGQIPEAVRRLEAAVGLDPNDAELHVTLGHLHSTCGSIEQARLSYSRAVAIDANHRVAGERLVELAVEPTTQTESMATLPGVEPGGEQTITASLPALASAPSTTSGPTTTSASAGDAQGKEAHELSYWKQRKQQEGTLANGHYRPFYTAHFGLPYEFYAGKRILDIGCGPRGSLEWADNALERVGLDPLADRYRELGASEHKMRYVAAPSEAIPFPDGYFDVVTSFNSLDHVADLGATLREISRVVKPGGLFLLLTDVNHSPTPCEPIEFSWDVVEQFKPDFEVVEQRHFEKVPKAGLYRSIEEALPYDHQNKARRYGILSARFLRLPVPIGSASMAMPSVKTSVGAEPEVERNAAAFQRLERSFQYLKERRFAEAQRECKAYREGIQYSALPRTDRRDREMPQVSVVIVAYKIGRGLIDCLNSLGDPSNPPHEVIVVDNGGNEDVAAELASRSLLHIRMPMNVILSEGRNVGVHFARAPIVAFVDDDAIVAPGFLQGVVEAFRTYDIDGYRGQVLPKTDHSNNSLARHYNMGRLAFPADVDTEGNSAFATAVYRDMGGMDPLLFGMEGTELSYRIAAARGEHRTIYWPGAVIHHDYANSEDKLGQKNARHQLMRDYAVWKHPHILKHHSNLIAFNQSETARLTGHQLIRQRSADSAGAAGTGTPLGAMPGALPFFSICIPTYNRARFIRETIESALKQTYPKYEIVIVDDGSTDGTESIVAEFTTPRLRYIRKEHSGGPATRNRCIAEARGEWLVWVDSDDVILPRTLETYAEELSGHPQIEVLYGDLRVINEKSVGETIWNYRDYFGWPEALLADSVIENRIPNVCTMVRRSCYDRVGAYSEEFPRAHDYEFWTRLIPNTVVRRVNAIVGLYRQHSNSLSQHSGKANTSYEARAVQRLIERHSLRTLMPWCYGPGFPEKRSEAYAWLIASVVMLKYGEVAAAREYLSRSRQAEALPAGERLLRIVNGLFDPAHGRNRSRAQRAGGNEVESLIEAAMKGYREGKAGDCAKASARLTDLQPEELETLALAGFSLMRWAEPRLGATAFRCLAHRLSEMACSELLEAQRPENDEAVSAEVDLGKLSARLAAPFGLETIPSREVQQTIHFLRELGTAENPRTYAGTRAASFTPLFWALVSLRPDELCEAGAGVLPEWIERARPAWKIDSKTSSRPRARGWSFCIITNGQRPEKLRRQMESIRALGIEDSEILVAGEVPPGLVGMVALPMPAAAAQGRLAQMRNALAAKARFDRVVMADDDMIFAPDFRQGLERFGDDFEVMAVRMLNPDGSRFWDWVTVGGARGQVLLDPWMNDPDIYVTGGLCIAKSAVLEQVGWDENRGFYEAEDVDFSRRLQAAGISIRFNPFCCVTHNDDRYTRVGRKVMRFDHIVNAAAQRFQANDRVEGQAMLEAAIRTAGEDPQRRAEVAAVAGRFGEANRVKFSSVSPPSKESNGTTPAVPAGTLGWEGTFLDLGSLSHVNRELTAAILRQAPESVIRIGRNTLPPNPGSVPALAEVAQSLQAQAPSSVPVTVRHAWPPDWRKPKQGAWVLIQPWEFGALPADWLRELSRVDEIWAPSEYVRSVYVNSGVHPGKVFVVPNGINPERFRPEAPTLSLPTQKRFRFLFVGGTIHRKGPDLLLQAYLDRFTASDDVCLVIKDFGGNDVYAGQTFEQKIAAAKARPNAPEILHLTDDLTPEQLNGLYTACDCLVHPYRGEGFALPVLEAMACGLPVVVTAGGATDDFATDEFAYRIPAARRQFGDSVSGMKLVKPGWFLEPDPIALGEVLRGVFENPEESRAKGHAASLHVREHWTWDRGARIALERASALASRETAKKSRAENRPARLELPPCARVGQLAEAREMLGRKQFVEAWNVIVTALGHRPHHPEAWLLLAEICATVGDATQARRLAERARLLAPRWRPALRFLKSNPRKPAHRVDLPPLPEALKSCDAPGRLSVCLIVRNEEQFLGRCLESIRGLASQLIVVDTGSTDSTRDIARQHGAEVYTFSWCDDFSAARNAALERATGDWILFLDADEELPASEHDKLRRLMTQRSAMAYRLPIVDQGREAEGVNYVPRLYRNAPGLFYVGRVHEQVFSSIEVRRAEWGLENKLGDATLLHHGYTKEVVASRDKIARNLRLLELAVNELPGEPNLLMNLGLELVRDGRLNEGLDRYREAFEAMSKQPRPEVSPELREALLTQYATHLITAKDYAEVARVLQSPLARTHGLTASMHWLLGLACIESKLYSEGAEQMRHCLNKRGRPTLTLANRNILKGGPHHCLALCLAAMKRREEAARAFEASLKEDGEARNVRYDYARFLAETGQEVEALKWLHQLMAEDPAEIRVWWLAGAVALEKPEFIEFALDWTGEAIKTHPQTAALIEQRATALLLSGQVEPARSLLRQLSSGTSPQIVAALLLCDLAEGQAPGGIPMGLAEKVDREFLKWYRRLLRWNATGVVSRLNERLDGLREFVPGAVSLIEQAIAEAAHA